MKKSLLVMALFVVYLPMMRAQSTVFISCHNPIDFWRYSGQNTAYFRLVDDLGNTCYDFMYLVDCGVSLDVGLYHPIGQTYLDSSRQYRIEWNIQYWFFMNLHWYGNNNPNHVRFYFRNDAIGERVEFCSLTFDATSYTPYYTLSYSYGASYSSWYDASDLSGAIENYSVEMAIE